MSAQLSTSTVSQLLLARSTFPSTALPLLLFALAVPATTICHVVFSPRGETADGVKVLQRLEGLARIYTSPHQPMPLGKEYQRTHTHTKCLTSCTSHTHRLTTDTHIHTHLRPTHNNASPPDRPAYTYQRTFSKQASPNLISATSIV
jgi:hypothetical protein